MQGSEKRSSRNQPEKETWDVINFDKPEQVAALHPPKQTGSHLMTIKHEIDYYREMADKPDKPIRAIVTCCSIGETRNKSCLTWLDWQERFMLSQQL
jgi:hypothetical protein